MPGGHQHKIEINKSSKYCEHTRTTSDVFAASSSYKYIYIYHAGRHLIRTNDAHLRELDTNKNHITPIRITIGHSPSRQHVIAAESNTLIVLLRYILLQGQPQ